MHKLLRFVIVAGLVLAGWAAPPPLALANSLDTTADLVIGQPGFVTNGGNHGGLNASGLVRPTAAVLDHQGNLYVADPFNNRVLVYDAPLSTHQAASVVLGQTDFFTNTANNGGLSASSLDGPVGLALDVFGNLYVADSSNNRVLKYDAPLSTHEAASHVIGQPTFSQKAFNNGGISARGLGIPQGVALDDDGNVYVADSLNNRVLVYGPLATNHPAATLVIGQPSFITNTVNNGGLHADSLANPDSLTVDAHGNLYVADSLNNRVLEYVTPHASHVGANLVLGQPSFITNTANSGGLNASGLNGPLGVALDAQGNLYVADFSNNRALEYNAPLATHQAAHKVFGQPGFGANGANNPTLGANSLFAPAGVVLDASGNLYIADYSNSRLLEYDLPLAHQIPALTVLAPSTVAAGSSDFTLSVNGAGFVAGSVVRWNGADRPTTYHNSIQLHASISAADVASGGPFAVTVFTPGSGGGTSTLMNLSLYARGGHDTQADLELGQPDFNHNVLNNPNLLHAGRLFDPTGAALDAHTGRLFLAGNLNSRVLSWPNAAALANGQPADLIIGQPNSVWLGANSGGRTARSLSFPHGVALDAAGNLYVADSDNNRVLEYNAPLSTGMAASHVFGQGGSFTNGAANNGGITANSLYAPAAMALDAAGRLYVADDGNNRVLEYDTPLTSQTANHVIGQPSPITNTANYNGVSKLSLYQPDSVALDAAGNLYVADHSNNRVLEYDTPLTTDGSADRVFGQAGFGLNLANRGQANPSNVSLFEPTGVAVDGGSRLYVADINNQRVLEFDGPLADQTADRVFGQVDFTHNDINLGQPNPSAASLESPVGVALDAQNNLYVVDTFNERVLEYDWAAARLALPVVLR